MERSFLRALELNPLSSATSAVVWAMIIFLVVLLVGIGLYFKKQLNRKKIEGIGTARQISSGKGFD